jgi:hypothetical protein
MPCRTISPRVGLPGGHRAPGWRPGHRRALPRRTDHLSPAQGAPGGGQSGTRLRRRLARVRRHLDDLRGHRLRAGPGGRRRRLAHAALLNAVLADGPGDSRLRHLDSLGGTRPALPRGGAGPDAALAVGLVGGPGLGARGARLSLARADKLFTRGSVTVCGGSRRSSPGASPRRSRPCRAVRALWSSHACSRCASSTRSTAGHVSVPQA